MASIVPCYFHRKFGKYADRSEEGFNNAKEQRTKYKSSQISLENDDLGDNSQIQILTLQVISRLLVHDFRKRKNPMLHLLQMFVNKNNCVTK